MNLHNILNQLHNFFPADRLRVMGKQCEFSQRSTSRLDGKIFAQLLVQTVSEGAALSLEGFRKRLYQIHKCKIKVQSLWERLVNPKAVQFMEMLYQSVWSLYLDHAKQYFIKLPSTVLEQFSGVLIQDTTVVSLNERLSSFFQGAGGTASKSSIKIDLIMDVLSRQLQRFQIIKDKRPDKALAADIIPFIKENFLIIRDMGFFTLPVFKTIAAMKAYFISRLHFGVQVYLSKESKESIDLCGYIDKHFKNCSHGALHVYLGKEEKLPVRLVWYRSPEQMVNERRRKVKRNSQKKGRTASQALLNWQKYTLLITNVPEEKIGNEVLGTIYRIRWGIELMFKAWKSNLHLDVLKGTRKERIEVFLYAKMISILLLSLVSDFLRMLACRIDRNYEISEAKVASFMVSERVFDLIIGGTTKKQVVDFLSDEYWITGFCKQIRKRKTTLQRINDYEPYYSLA